VRVADLALAVVLMGIGLTITTAPAAADEGWTITSFHSDITVSNDSTLNVEENIQVDFGALQKHGIFRTIPLRYHYDQNRDRLFDIQVTNVIQGTDAKGVPTAWPYADAVQDGNLVIKIGDSQKYVSGPQTYVITYKVSGAMNSFADHDEIFWNVDGAQWPVPKQQVSASVHIPAGSLLKATCFEGAAGSQESCTSADANNVVTYATKRVLASDEQLSIVAGIKKGLIAIPPPNLVPRLRTLTDGFFDLTPLTLGASIVVFLIGVGYVVRSWLINGRDRQYLTQYYLTNDPRESAAPITGHEPVVVEFTPPQNLRPAELGVILDERADVKDLTATMVDLAVRGFLTMSEASGDWTLTRTAVKADGLLPYETTILTGLFAASETLLGGQDDATDGAAFEADVFGPSQAIPQVSQVRLSDLKGHFAVRLRAAESALYRNSVSKSWFRIRPDQARSNWGWIGVLVAVLGAGAAYGLGLFLGWGMIGLALVAVGLFMLATMRLISVRTAAGRELLQHTLGFRLYMNTAENYRQQFAANAGIFTLGLPYAIVFGCVRHWAKAFEGLDTSGFGSWYSGSNGFQASVIADSLLSLNSGISAAISAPSVSAVSGFSGAGGAGGGGGGGGGGSW